MSKVSKSPRVRSTAPKSGSRKAKWVAQFDQLLAEFKKTKPGSIEFVQAHHKLLQVAGRLIGEDQWKEYTAAGPIAYDRKAAKLADRIGETLNRGRDINRFYVNFDVNVYSNACEPVLCFESGVKHHFNKQVTSENMATIIVENIRQDAAELLAMADNIEKKFVAKPSRKAR
jgi:hypothetical protein